MSQAQQLLDSNPLTHFTTAFSEMDSAKAII